MVLRVLGSSSAGNCYILDNGKEALVLECGVSLSKVKESVGYDISRIAGAFVSHEHNDHFTDISPTTNWRSCLEHGEKIGLGSREYELVEC